ncbi:MAG: DUF3106 domain-containing protein [Burkholderiaceae bacterium]
MALRAVARRALGLAAACVIGGSAITTAAAPVAMRTPPKAEEGVRWRDLSPAQRTALRPLERDWHTVDAIRKRKWVEIASRFGTLAPADQLRIQERMTAWAKMTPEQRGQVRLQFQEAQRAAPQDRQAQWAAYQALPPDEKRQLAARAATPAATASAAVRDARRPLRPAPPRSDRPGREAGEVKSNIVPNPGLAAPPKPVAPTVVQAGSGVSTTLISRRPNPPPHQQTGLPKIAATPGYVDASTLLPQRGPQGAATRPAARPADAPASKQP